ncbi:MAG: tRNA 4-thiouridine(8) synthase ThiI [Acidobacteria bacterium]|nr:tRNA 4-thiouridine(8) synthase ThiI [Acidobacteriota bacterium]MBU4306961.1 tRNA 4-thiouridine(8) synthase ThiI [Acidobacteriota bacterium]MBU4404995.1 tRNA 4-thiouridine(8) synthase ThiI [Acidobacteriota bacterium]MCG2812176.1 tRNA 4-thiouridine(8) synthase ThiI [Candidatus Aminicenantes bacterium]
MNGLAVIVRYGEISLKGRNRGQFEQKLKNDLAWFLKKQGHTFAKISAERGRIYIRGINDLPDLKKVLGVYSYSPAFELDRDYDALKKEVARFFPEIRSSSNFRVSCQRIAKDFSPNSMGVEREIGSIISEQTGTPVRLKDPDFELHIEIGHRHLYLFSEKIRGFGGFPVGSAGKLVSLISGGIDSPVATFLMMKRGVMPVLLHFGISENETTKVLRLRDRLEEFAAGQPIKLIIIPREELFQGKFSGLFGTRHEPYVCVICKYLMHRKAGEIAKSEKALGVISGDNLAQVASQTLKNLYASRAAATMPIYSPLIAYEKSETVALAKQIGTYELSIAKAEGCTPPRHPKTGVDFERLRKVLRETGFSD